MSSSARTVDDGGVVLVDMDLLGGASMSSVDVLELDAGSSLISTGGQDGDVLEHRLAAIAKARRLDGGDLQSATQLLTTSVASASPSTSSAMMSSGRPDWATSSSRGSNVCRLASFFSWMGCRAHRARRSSSRHW